MGAQEHMAGRYGLRSGGRRNDNIIIHDGSDSSIISEEPQYVGP